MRLPCVVALLVVRVRCFVGELKGRNDDIHICFFGDGQSLHVHVNRRVYFRTPRYKPNFENVTALKRASTQITLQYSDSTPMQCPSPQLLRALRANLLSSSFPKAAIVNSGRPLCRFTYSRISSHRVLSSIAAQQAQNPSKPSNPKLQTRDRGPPSEEDTQTDFRTLDIYSNTTPPATVVDACLYDGFHLNNGTKITKGDGVLLVGGEAFAWRPWGAVASNNADGLLAGTGALDLSHPQMFGIISLINPLPDLLILGTGATTRPVTKKTRELLASLGLKIDIMDTRNAAASFNLLSTERGTEGVAAAMIPVGWKGR